MSIFNRASSAAAAEDNFDLLRARLEMEATRPAVIAITASSPQDRKDIAALGLANSLAASGYATLFLDTSVGDGSKVVSAKAISFEDIAAQLKPAEPAKLATLSLKNAAQQGKISQREIRATLDLLRGKFDYIVVDTENGVPSSFAMAIVAAADAVVLVVKLGRRRKKEDARLAAALDGLGSRFLGVVALHRSTIENASRSVSYRPVGVEKETERREVVNL